MLKGKSTGGTQVRSFDLTELAELVAGVASGRFVVTDDAQEVLDGLAAGRFSEATALAMFRKVSKILVRPRGKM